MNCIRCFSRCAMACFWLAGLPWPGSAQNITVLPKIIVPPKNVSVCHGQEAVFNATAEGGDYSTWSVNETSIDTLLSNMKWKDNNQYISDGQISDNISNISYIYLKVLARAPLELFNNTEIQAVASFFDELSVKSDPVWLTYMPFALQYPVANLTKTVNLTHIRLDWQPPENNTDLSYLLTMRNITNPEAPVEIDCDQCLQLFNDTFYEFPSEETCSVYEFRVTAIAEGCLNQVNFTDITGSLSEALDTNLSASLTRLGEDRVQADWSPGPGNSYRLVIDEGNEAEPILHTECVNCPPYNHTLENCQEENNISVTVFIPSEHCDDLRYPRQAHIQFRRDCPTLMVATSGIPSATGVPSASSGTLQARIKHGFIAAIAQAALVWVFQGFTGR